jgi:YcxB-like protein
MEGAVEGSVALTADDLDQASAAAPQGRGTLLILLGAFLLVPQLLRVIAGFDEVRALGLFGALRFGLWRGLAALWLLSLGVLVRWKSSGKRQLAALPEGERDVRYRFDDTGARITTSLSDLSLPYRTLVGYVEGKHGFLLYTHDYKPKLIPKRAFAPADVERLRSWLATNARVPFFARFKWSTVLVICLLMAVAGAVVAALQRS